jgi:D-beta-D-heptose 7-phosphate kinase/D-beta-D-heptose 1-phosphate adenosyltransferase
MEITMTTVFVNGTFDILHPGHIKLLDYAASLGDKLVVAIDTDTRVRQLKGNSRPFFNEHDRKFMLESLKVVDQVYTFNSNEDLENIIKTTKPNIMVKGSDYRGKTIVGEQYIPTIKFFERINDYSSTISIQHLADR